MTPEDKAKQLMNKIYKDVYSNFSKKGTSHTRKQCALICVDEITEILMNLRGEFMDLKNISYSKTESLEYWQEVKQQIEKL